MADLFVAEDKANLVASVSSVKMRQQVRRLERGKSLTRAFKKKAFPRIVLVWGKALWLKAIFGLEMVSFIYIKDPSLESPCLAQKRAHRQSDVYKHLWP